MFSKIIVASAILGAGMTYALAADMPSKSASPPAPLPFFFVNDNTISFSDQFTATDPGDHGTTSKKVVNFTHFDVWAYGTNFFTIDVLKSDKNDPASPCLDQHEGCAGATEIYGLFRSTFGWNEIFGTKAFSMGPLSDISFEVGADANSENNFLAPAKRDVVAGLEFTFALPYMGHFNVSPLFYKEWNHNSFLTPAFVTLGPVDGDTNFNGTWAIETGYALPLGFLPASFPLTLSGYANWYGPKGTGISPLVPLTTVPKTVVEFNSQQKLSLDLGQMILGPSHADLFDVWVAYRYWQNKFGLDHTKGVCLGPTGGGCTEQSWVTGVSVTF
jgi:hypothetical protein